MRYRSIWWMRTIEGHKWSGGILQDEERVSCDVLTDIIYTQEMKDLRHISVGRAWCIRVNLDTLMSGWIIPKEAKRHTIAMRYGFPMIAVLFDKIAKLGIFAASDVDYYSYISEERRALTIHSQVHARSHGNNLFSSRIGECDLKIPYKKKHACLTRRNHLYRKTWGKICRQNIRYDAILLQSSLYGCNVCILR
jgi:hypothetical protein